MNSIVKWLADHKISTHTLAVLGAGLILYYRINPDFNALVTQVQSHIPKWVITLGIAGAWLYSWYRNGASTSAVATPTPASSKSTQGGFIRIAVLQMLLPALLTFSLITQVVFIAGCGKVQQDLQTVLKKAPTVVAIVETGIDLASIVDPNAVDPGFRPLVASISGEIIADLQLLSDGIAQYQTDIASAPPGTIAKAQELYKVIDGKLTQFEQAFHLKGQKAEAEAAAIVDFVDVFLSELGSLLPPAPVTVVAQATPRTQAALVGVKVTIISARQFARNFNKASAQNFPQIVVAVP